MRILVTGSNGLLGQKLVTLLSGFLNVEVFATGRGPNRNPEGRYNYHSADLCNESEIHTLIATSKPEIVIHCAAMTQVDDCELNQEACDTTNVDATRLLLQACKPLNPHFQYISTDFVFDGMEGPYREEDIPNPVSYYGASKLAAEELVMSSGLPYSIVRTVLVYGVAHDLSRSNIVLWVKKSLENGQSIKVVNDQWRTPTLVEDLADGCWLILKNKKEGIFHISGAETYTPYELALQVASFFNLNESLITPVDANTFTQPGKRPPKTGFIIEKAASELGFKPHRLSEGLRHLQKQLNQN